MLDGGTPLSSHPGAQPRKIDRIEPVIGGQEWLCRVPGIEGAAKSMQTR